MGYRLYFAQHYAPDWKGGYFNHNFDNWELLFDAKFAENGWRAESEDQFEVERADVKAYVEELKKLLYGDINEFFPKDSEDSGYTNAQIIELLEQILTSDDDTIRIEFS